MKLRFPHRVALFTLLASSAMAAGAAPLAVDGAGSGVSVVFKELNVPVEAKFKKINFAIDYDNAKPETGKANIDIDVGSFDLGEPDMNKEVLKKEWFNAAQFPKANFVSSAIKVNAPGKLTVLGKLTLKGKTADVSFPVTVKNEGGKQIFDGALPIKRLAFSIGEGEWKDTSTVADDVTIKFHVATGH